MLFSERKGLSPVKIEIQRESIDNDLKNGLWNALYLNIWAKYDGNTYNKTFRTSNLFILLVSYWHNFFKLPLDSMPLNFSSAQELIKKKFFTYSWFELYDFIEFTAQNCPSNLKNNFIKFVNSILEKELSAYRFVDEQLTDITDEQEIESIETAIDSSNKFSGTNIHLKAALSFLTDRKKPDYRNSVKESISAVEALCVTLSGDPKATLGASLNSIEKSHSLHPAFKKALTSLYGYTSDSDGIRHALLDESNISYSDAKYMLVSCSAFINYVIGKISEN
ncbi:AbiJ-NTD4 domain-containing protein [Acinetobacter calcoaceticus]